MTEQKHISLLELNHIIKDTIQQELAQNFWIVAEISECNENYRGHCYLELIEKQEEEDQIIAKARATIWSSAYRIIKPYFETTTGQGIQPGIKIMVKVKVNYHELYGLSLNITDIEPTFTVGELERQKRAIINRLTKEGIIDLNHQLPFPVLPKNIAIISSATAAGYGDFCDQLDNNQNGYAFHYNLFPAVVQGMEAETSIMAALDKIFEYEKLFDVVVLIRGGGSQTDLNCFNSYMLASYVAQFPIPVLTGIGHERDETITDMVAYTALKTPTAVAEFLVDSFSIAEDQQYELISRFRETVLDQLAFHENLLQNNSTQLKNVVSKQIHIKDTGLNELKFSLSHTCSLSFSTNMGIINQFTDNFKHGIHLKMEAMKYQLQAMQMQLSLNNPQNILKRGYSITLKEDKPVIDANEIEKEEVITTLLYKGSLKSKVVS